MDLSNIDNKEFEERADYIEINDLINWTVDTPFYQKIQKKIIERGAKLIVGPRGTGKTHQFRHAYYTCLNDNNKPLPLYISFGKYYHLEPLLFKSANALNVFHSWILGKICLEIINVSKNLKVDIQQSLNSKNIDEDEILEFIENAERNLINSNNDEVILKLSIQFVTSLIEEVLIKSNRRRCILLLDDAALTLTPDYMIEFFDVFRSLKTQNISPKASVYPGTTQYGPRFHIGQDAEEVLAWLNVEDENYSNFMSEILSKRLNILEINTDIVELFKYASFGIPRAFITLLRAFIQSTGKTTQQNFNKVIENQQNLLEKEYLSLALKLPQYKSIIKIGHDFYERVINEIEDANRLNPAEKKIHIGILQDESVYKSSRMIKFLIEAGLLYQIQALSDGHDRTFNRYIPHYLFLLHAKVFTYTKGFNPKSILESITKKTDKRPIRKQLSTLLTQNQIENLKLDLPACNNCGTERISEDQKFCHNCGNVLVGQSTFETTLKTKIKDLPLPKWQIEAILKDTDLKTIEDIYSSQNLAKDLKNAKGIGKVRTTNIDRMVKDLIQEFLT
ncbi:TPA: zinc ribbon domain-containing protein [Elizabethkingia anophelis]